MGSFVWNNHAINFNNEGDGAPLLFVHGLGGNADNWLHQRRAFREKRRVISVDLPGHGRSEGAEISFMRYWESIASLLDHLQIPAIDICGLSKGARVALMLARRQPGLVRSVTVVNSFLWLRPEDGQERRRLYDLLLLDDGGHAWAEALLAKMGIPADGAIAKGFRRSLATIRPERIRERFYEMVDYDQRDELRSIECPVLIVRGERDGFIPPYCAEDMLARLPRSQIASLPTCGHLPYLEQPQAFNRVLEDFYAAL